MAKYELQEVSVVLPALYAAAGGFLAGLVPMALAMFAQAQNVYGTVDIEDLLPFLLIPAIMAVWGFVTVALGLWLYNLATSRIGGVRMDLEFIPEDDE